MASEAQLKANKKYHDKFDNIRVRVPGGQKDLIENHAADMGETVNTFVRRAIAETMERDKQNKK